MTQRSMPSTKKLLLLAATTILIASLDDARLLAAQDPPTRGVRVCANAGTARPHEAAAAPRPVEALRRLIHS